MTDQTTNYDDVKRYRLDPEREHVRILAAGMAMAGDSANAFTANLDPDRFVRFLDTPERIVLEFTPEISIPFDGDKMAAGTAAAYAQFAAEDAATGT
ncbi:MAG: hypothetical protein VB949_16690 [Pseudomonadales bacterium]|jgi:hypothetical protein